MPLPVVKTNFIKSFLGIIFIAIFAVLFFAPAIVQAEPYGTGSYGECKYGEDCPASTTTGGSSSTPSSTTTTEEKVRLNDFNEYFAVGGKQLQLKEKQVIYFDIKEDGKTETHYLTIINIGPDFVEFSFDGSSDIQKLTIGSKNQYDVTKNGQNDIEITLDSIDGNQATITFRQVGATTPTDITTPKPETDGPVKDSGFNWTLPVFGLMLLAGLAWFLIWFIRKRKNTTF